MSIAPQNLLLNPRSTHLCFYSNHTPRATTPLKNPIFTLSISPKNGVHPPLHYEILTHKASNRELNSLHWPLRVFESEGEIQREGFDKFNFDSFLSVAEVLCLTPSAVFSIGCAVNWAFSTSKNSFQVSIGNRVFMWQFVMLVGAVFIGGLIRRRQWRRICRDSKKSSSPSFNLIERIEKVEEDLRSSATIIKVLSRQLEKLGIRFRVTRKAMKEPIAETAALAQKNSEATRALAAHEDILEKELGEIQKVLLAMQEQQQKQLELILAVIKAGKERKSKQEPVAEQEVTQNSNSVPDNKPTKEMETQTQTQTGDRHDGRA